MIDAKVSIMEKFGNLEKQFQGVKELANTNKAQVDQGLKLISQMDIYLEEVKRVVKDARKMAAIEIPDFDEINLEFTRVKD